jgi:hypothetical protein
MATISLLVSMLLLFLISSTDGACTTTGNTQGNCGGRSYDLCSIMKQPASLPDNIDDGGSKYTFEIDFCNGISSCHTQDGDPPAAVCQSTIADPSKSFNCGSTNNTSWDYDDSADTSNGFQFTVTFPNGRTQGNGDTRQTTFTFVDNGTAFDLTYLGENTGADKVINYYFIVSVSSPESPVGIIGLVLMLLAFFALVTYFIVGALIMYFYKGARGLEIIPNYMFWKDLPFLIKDGFMFIISPCYKRGSYEKI